MSAVRDIKTKIARQFSRAAARYDEAAQVQRLIAGDALALLPQYSQTMLDIGCGSGRVSRQLRNQCRQLLALDLAHGMVDYANQFKPNDIAWLVGDAERLPLADECVTTVFSSMAMQWCENLGEALQEVSRVLTPGGSAVVALMSEGSMRELDCAWQSIERTRHVNRFVSEEEIQQALNVLPVDYSLTTKPFVTYHDNVRALLRSIKDIGANVVTDTEQRPLQRCSVLQLEEEFRRSFSSEKGLSLTYHVSFIQLIKRAAN